MEIAKLELKDGDMLIVRPTEPVAAEEAAYLGQALKMLLADWERPDVMVVVGNFELGTCNISSDNALMQQIVDQVTEKVMALLHSKRGPAPPVTERDTPPLVGGWGS